MRTDNIDARWEDAESGGDETVGGSTATPGRNDLDAIGSAIGVTYAAGEGLKVGETGELRDTHRWESQIGAATRHVVPPGGIRAECA